ncbi:MAG TPA: hypothetical protein VGD79_01215 [Thermoanaerobaculia bacterium]|jgi:hypothetical protein
MNAREPRYRFSDDVRATTRAIALRMIHAGAVAGSAEELEAWIAQTDDIRERLTQGGYGSAFTAGDLFPLFQGQVARATAAKAPRSEPRPRRWLWIAVILAVVAAVILGVLVTGRFAL